MMSTTLLTPELADQRIRDVLTAWAGRPLARETVGEWVLRRYDADPAATVAYALGVLIHADDDTHPTLTGEAFDQQVRALAVERGEWLARADGGRVAVRVELDPDDGVHTLGQYPVSGPLAGVDALVDELVWVVAWCRDRLDQLPADPDAALGLDLDIEEPSWVGGYDTTVVATSSPDAVRIEIGGDERGRGVFDHVRHMRDLVVAIEPTGYGETRVVIHGQWGVADGWGPRPGQRVEVAAQWDRHAAAYWLVSDWVVEFARSLSELDRPAVQAG